jgi:hypothetical protein
MFDQLIKWEGLRSCRYNTLKCLMYICEESPAGSCVFAATVKLGKQWDGVE